MVRYPFQTVLAGPAEVSAHATHALILLHGFGANGDDLLGLAGPLKATLSQFDASLADNLAILCPHGPSPAPFGGGRQWFADAGWTFNDATGQAATHALLVEYVAAVSDSLNIPLTNIILGGFSQGGMQTLYTLPRLNPGLGGGITLAGALTQPASIRPEPAALCPLLMLHGLADDVLPADRTQSAAATLTSWGYAPEMHLLDDLPHGIDARCLAYVADFLVRTWST
jgi:phospholipase/carboxylesterase